MERLSLSKPVIQAPMAGGPTTPRLAAAVSDCGGLGSLASGYLTPEVLQRQILETKKLTSAGFQVNLFIPENGKTSDGKNMKGGKRRYLMRIRLHPCQKRNTIGTIFTRKSKSF